MPFYEVIFETGAHSVIQVDNPNDLERHLDGLKQHHERATSGVSGGPAGQVAERIARVLEYSNDPTEMSAPRYVSAEVAKKHTADVLKTYTDEDGVIDLAAAGAMLEPRPIVETPPHDSNYTAKETKELDPKQWGAD